MASDPSASASASAAEDEAVEDETLLSDVALVRSSSSRLEEDCSSFLPKSSEYSGDYLSNWVRRLIPVNPRMSQDFAQCRAIIDYWFRTEKKQKSDASDDSSSDASSSTSSSSSHLRLLPESIITICGEFYVWIRCNSCGVYRNLWLNLSDGFIGCGRSFYFDPSLGGKGCSLKHYDSVPFAEKEKHAVVVKLGTLTEDWADLHNYYLDSDEVITKDSAYREELEERLKYWGIDPNEMEKFDLTLSEISEIHNERETASILKRSFHRSSRR